LEYIGGTILLSVNSKDIQLASRQKLIEELHQPCPRNTGKSFWKVCTRYINTVQTVEMGGCIFCTVINLVYFVICVVVGFATTADNNSYDIFQHKLNKYHMNYCLCWAFLFIYQEVKITWIIAFYGDFIRCEFSHLGGWCGKFNHYTNNKVDQIDNCTKDTTTHLNRLHSIDVSSANFPEGLLLVPDPTGISCVVKSQYSLDRVGVIPLSAFPLLPTGCPLNWHLIELSRQ
jgi:hypothetical protein